MSLDVSFGKWQPSTAAYHTTIRQRIIPLRPDDARDHESQVTRLVFRRIKSEEKVVELRDSNDYKAKPNAMPPYVLRLIDGNVILLKVSRQLQELDSVGLQRVRNVLASAPSHIPIPPPLNFSNPTPPKNFVTTSPLKYLSPSTATILPPDIDARTFTSVAPRKTDVLNRYFPISGPSVLFDESETDVINNLQPLKTAMYEGKVDAAFVTKCKETWKLMGIAWTDPDILFPDDGNKADGSKIQKKKIELLFNEVLLFLERHRTSSVFHDQLYNDACKTLSAKMNAMNKPTKMVSDILERGISPIREGSTSSNSNIGSKRESSVGSREGSVGIRKEGSLGPISNKRESSIDILSSSMTRDASIDASFAEVERQKHMTYREQQDLITSNTTQLDLPMPPQKGPGFIGRGGPPQPMTVLPSYLIVKPPVLTPQQSDAKARQVWGKEGGRGWLYWANLEEQRRIEIKRRFNSLEERDFDGGGANGMNWRNGLEYGDNSNRGRGPKRQKKDGVEGVVDYVLYE